MLIQTERLQIRELSDKDAHFIIRLLNTPSWLEFIGDKGVHDLDSAINYLKTGPLASYEEHGYGLWLVELEQSNTPIGMCGLVNRDTLDDIDIGFALLPDFSNQGYGYEAAAATMRYAKHQLKIDKVVGITDPSNKASIALLNKIGLQFKKTVTFNKDDTALLFSPCEQQQDRQKIDQLVDSFFAVFDNRNAKVVDIQKLKEMFIKQAVIINNSNQETEIYNLDEFIKPRQRLLTNGQITDFTECEISQTTQLFENIAQRNSLYHKTGKFNGKPFSTVGVKKLQLVKIDNSWYLSSVSWSDQKPS